ncbi:MAG: N-acetylmuramoyl-L-alanine amidase [Rhizobiales bacterium]|nr:N-acetylmuramoyl-L-alanine amidase [Hyphomicrobiales bacterium]
MASVVISSGHGEKISGASGVLNEVDEARRVVDCVAEMLPTLGVSVTVFHDDVSDDQSENLKRIVDFHNAQTRNLDVSVHFNAHHATDKPMGTECLWLTQEALAEDVSAAISAASGLIDRGAKRRTDLYFLNHTTMPAILIEVCFVDSSTDAAIYTGSFEQICAAIAKTIAKTLGADVPPRPPQEADATVDIQITTTGNVKVTVNGKPIVVAW